MGLVYVLVFCCVCFLVMVWVRVFFLFFLDNFLLLVISGLILLLLISIGVCNGRLVCRLVDRLWFCCIDR